ncbi:predicted protein [Histoplasma capsulatum var. duboisii H88]|uniref:Predicted protein n=1 Tax=Ajellomyces capsulatus (strain H88) TaxID=544711 RepID=F0UK14_AJEC8|nr:predicted protein [Histoplasma capsulatum var. duboisii H88]
MTPAFGVICGASAVPAAGPAQSSLLSPLSRWPLEDGSLGYGPVACGWIDLLDSPSLIGWKSRLFGCRLKPDIQDIPKERAEHSRAGSTPIYLLLGAFIIWEAAIMTSCS